MRSAFAVIRTYHEKDDADAQRVRMWYFDFDFFFFVLFFLLFFHSLSSILTLQRKISDEMFPFFQHYIRIDWVCKHDTKHTTKVPGLSLVRLYMTLRTLTVSAHIFVKRVHSKFATYLFSEVASSDMNNKIIMTGGIRIHNYTCTRYHC